MEPFRWKRNHTCRWGGLILVATVSGDWCVMEDLPNGEVRIMADSVMQVRGKNLAEARKRAQAVAMNLKTKN